MRKTMLLVSLVAALVVGLAGCATRQVDSYVPQSIVRYENRNTVSVAKFVYEPMATLKMRQDQIENTALGNFYLKDISVFGGYDEEISVAELVRKATISELENSGMQVKDGANLKISCDIIKFKADDLGFRVHYYYSVRYKITRIDTAEEIFSREYTPEMMNTRKIYASLATLVGFIHKVISRGVNMFIGDPDVRRILDAPSPANA